MQNSQTLTPIQVGEILGIGRNVTYRLIHEGTIPALRLGKKLRVPKLALDELLRNPQQLGREGEKIKDG